MSISSNGFIQKQVETLGFKETAISGISYIKKGFEKMYKKNVLALAIVNQ